MHLLHKKNMPGLASIRFDGRSTRLSSDSRPQARSAAGEVGVAGIAERSNGAMAASCAASSTAFWLQPQGPVRLCIQGIDLTGIQYSAVQHSSVQPSFQTYPAAGDGCYE